MKIVIWWEAQANRAMEVIFQCITEVYRVNVNSEGDWTLLAFYDRAVLVPKPRRERSNDVIVVISQINKVCTFGVNLCCGLYRLFKKSPTGCMPLSLKV